MEPKLVIIYFSRVRKHYFTSVLPCTLFLVGDASRPLDLLLLPSLLEESFFFPPPCFGSLGAVTPTKQKQKKKCSCKKSLELFSGKRNSVHRP